MKLDQARRFEDKNFASQQNEFYLLSRFRNY